VAGWTTFYATAGAASAALIGLLFVGISINLDTVVGHPEVRASARGSFSALVAILVISLVVLIPQVDPSSLGYTLIGEAAVGLWGTGGQVRAIWGASLLLERRRVARQVGFRVLGLGLLLVSGILFQVDAAAGQLWLMATLFVLLAYSADAAWSLLIAVAEAKGDLEPAGTAAAGVTAARPAETESPG
jgi:hypothetical protein